MQSRNNRNKNSLATLNCLFSEYNTFRRPAWMPVRNYHTMAWYKFFPFYASAFQHLHCICAVLAAEFHCKCSERKTTAWPKTGRNLSVAVLGGTANCERSTEKTHSSFSSIVNKAEKTTCWSRTNFLYRISKASHA